METEFVSGTFCMTSRDLEVRVNKNCVDKQTVILLDCWVLSEWPLAR